MKIVITGAPCSGKTTIIEELKKYSIENNLGYVFVREAARDIIEECKYDPRNNPEKFEYDILRKRLEYEKNAEGDIIICDRGAHDTLSYHLKEGVKPSTNLLKNLEKFYYDLAFCLEPFKNFYEKDNARDETREEQLILAEYTKQVYEESGIKTIMIPEFSQNREENIKMRVEKILSEISTLES